MKKFAECTGRVLRRVAWLVSIAGMWLAFTGGTASAQDAAWPQKTYYRYQEVKGSKIFYREAGDANAPVILLLHGFPTTSHAYRDLIPLLSGRFHVIAPDYLGSGFSDKPDPAKVTYTFDLLAEHVNGLVAALGIKEYVVYMHDFGGPVGMRAMLAQPDKVRGLIIQNANAYVEGLGVGRMDNFKRSHDDTSKEGIARVLGFTAREGFQQRQYLRDVKGREDVMSPDTWTSDLAFLDSEKERNIQVQLFQDYYNNILAYPQWQALLRKKQPPTLIVWGKNDPVFTVPGAQAYLRDLPKAELHLLDAGHFAVEEKTLEIAKYITGFMTKLDR